MERLGCSPSRSTSCLSTWAGVTKPDVAAKSTFHKLIKWRHDSVFFWVILRLFLLFSVYCSAIVKVPFCDRKCSIWLLYRYPEQRHFFPYCLGRIKDIITDHVIALWTSFSYMNFGEWKLKGWCDKREEWQKNNKLKTWVWILNCRLQSRFFWVRSEDVERRLLAGLSYSAHWGSSCAFKNKTDEWQRKVCVTDVQGRQDGNRECCVVTFWPCHKRTVMPSLKYRT